MDELVELRRGSLPSPPAPTSSTSIGSTAAALSPETANGEESRGGAGMLLGVVGVTSSLPLLGSIVRPESDCDSKAESSI